MVHKLQETQVIANRSLQNRKVVETLSNFNGDVMQIVWAKGRHSVLTTVGTLGVRHSL